MSVETNPNQKAQIAAGLHHFFFQQYYDERSKVTPECLDQMYDDANAYADNEIREMMSMEGNV